MRDQSAGPKEEAIRRKLTPQNRSGVVEKPKDGMGEGFGAGEIRSNECRQ
jgi:hypothetical protein